MSQITLFSLGARPKQTLTHNLFASILFYFIFNVFLGVCSPERQAVLQQGIAALIRAADSPRTAKYKVSISKHSHFILLHPCDVT